jgi:large subunit ribosomal protein L24
MQRLRVGDTVQVISGKDRSKTGRIIKVLRDEDKVIVEGINVVARHQKPRDRSQAGEIVKKPAPIAACKVMPLDPETGKPTRVHFEDRDGQKVRVAKSGAVIPSEAK